MLALPRLRNLREEEPLLMEVTGNLGEREVVVLDGKGNDTV